jgi:hypothetical protein
MRTKLIHIAIILLLFHISSISTYSQVEKRFEYKRLSNFSNVTPVFDQTKPEGTMGMPIGLREKYAVDLFTIPIKEILKNKRDSLSFGTGIYIILDRNGNIINCSFMINHKDSSIISEDDLYNLYLKFKNLKVDTTKIKIYPFNGTNFKRGDYARIVIPFFSEERRTQIMRSRL